MSKQYPHDTAHGSRRALLKAGVAVGAIGGLGMLAELAKVPVELAATPANLSPALPAGKANAITWQNWSGIQSCHPLGINSPANESAIADLFKQSSGTIRCVGAGHSFVPLVPTDGTIVSLDKMSGIIDRHDHLVRVQAGTRLAQLARELDGIGLAMHNQPDIDAQSFAGAISTATHGTGKELPALHAKVQALRLLTPTGEILTCDANTNADLLQAARVSLGSLGVITEVTLEAVPAYYLQRKVWLRPVDDMLAMAHDLANQHRHFEFYYLPFTGYAAAITHNIVNDEKIVRPESGDEAMLHDLRQLRDWMGRFPDLRRWLAKKLIDPQQVELAQDKSWKLLSTSRPTKFNESECHVPQEHGINCVREVIQKLEQRHDVFFPLEFRFVKADDAWLSPFYQRETCSIAVHAAAGEAYQYLVQDIAPIFRKYQGRPHWGKLHAHQAADLSNLYPRWKDFLAIREHCDPHGRMLNPHLRQVFGVSA
ncbi:D-arabinono-1,4-lactone oxidase [Undibacterium sp. SXout11W]|uniref:D-arabinono-1,4-lactone oxidase n=1 Tax=Undibacterium sp. SXout11W TaxID=3413050 RepID=UPI003BF0BEA3